MEHPLFEQRIRDSILKHCGGLPIISVTQKPIDFGANICVGDDIGVSGFNFFRQVLIGCKAATTKYIISAEADTVYPPDYFEYRPPTDDVCYRNSNLYVMGDHRNYWYRKAEGATHSQVVGRGFYIKTLEKLFEGAPMWSATEKNFPKERLKKEDVFDKIEYWETENPVFQIKTHRSMRYYTNSDRTPVHELPFWGKGADIRNHYFKDVPEVYSQI
jgi:hypothetical protein